jgi:ketosteroid isomerase-like protein
VAGDVAYSVATSTTKGTYQGRAVDSQGAELIVARRANGGWKIAAIHWSSRRR